MGSILPGEPVDLHLHTLASDGFWTVETLVNHLSERGFRVAAICDHDTMAAVAEAIERGAQHGLRVIPGVEVTTRWHDRQWHLLVYGVDPELPRARLFRGVLDELADRMWAEAITAVVTLERHGYRLRSLREVAAGRPLRPYHVLLALIREGYATNLATAHELTKRLGEPMTVDLPLERVVTAAHSAGGVCVLAHPGRDDATGRLTEDALVQLLTEVPIDGLEVHYRSHSREQAEMFRRWCERYSLVASSGSDSHAPGHPVDPISYPAESAAELLRKFGLEVALSEVRSGICSGK